MSLLSLLKISSIFLQVLLLRWNHQRSYLLYIFNLAQIFWQGITYVLEADLTTTSTLTVHQSKPTFQVCFAMALTLE